MSAVFCHNADLSAAVPFNYLRKQETCLKRVMPDSARIVSLAQFRRLTLIGRLGRGCYFDQSRICAKARVRKRELCLQNKENNFLITSLPASMSHGYEKFRMTANDFSNSHRTKQVRVAHCADFSSLTLFYFRYC